MRKLIYVKLHEKYGDEPDPRIRRRVEQELRLMDLCKLNDQLKAVYELAESLKEKKIPFAMGGESGNSILLYLLDITETNPLPPHYYDAERKVVEFASDLAETETKYRPLLGIRDGFDLPDRGFDHEGTWEPDGHDLAMELFWGAQTGDKEGFNPPQISMRVPESVFEDVKRRLKMEPALASKGYQESGRIGFYCGCLHIISSILLPGESDNWFLPVSYSMLRKYCLQHFQSILKLDQGRVKPQTFLGVLKMYGLSRGSWSNIVNQKQVTLDSGEDDTIYTLVDFAYSLDVVPAFYDEVMEILLQAGMDRIAACKQAERVHHGRGLTDGLTEIYYENNRLPWCNYAIHLFPKAHGIEYLIMCWKIEQDRRLKAQKEAERQLEQERIAGRELTKEELGQQQTVEIRSDDIWKLKDGRIPAQIPQDHRMNKEEPEDAESGKTTDEEAEGSSETPEENR